MNYISTSVLYASLLAGDTGGGGGGWHAKKERGNWQELERKQIQKAVHYVPVKRVLKAYYWIVQKLENGDTYTILHAEKSFLRS